jgi:hypothetical protein
MRLIRLAWVVAALSLSWAVNANPAINGNVSGTIASPAVATTQMVAGQTQVRLDGTGRGSSSSATAGTDDSMRGWLMLLVAVLLIGHQLRRKHRFLRPQRFSDL